MRCFLDVWIESYTRDAYSFALQQPSYGLYNCFIVIK
jgi:hypothetical protein